MRGEESLRRGGTTAWWGGTAAWWGGRSLRRGGTAAWWGGRRVGRWSAWCGVLLFLAQVPLHAASGLGTSGAAFLRIAPTARPMGMGGAYTGTAEGVDALYYNPAGLATIGRTEVALTHIEMLLAIDFEYIGFAHRLSDRDALGASLTYLSADDTRRDALGNVVGEFSNSDLAVGLAYARALSERLSFGVTGRFIRSRLADFDATAFGADLGLRYRVRGIEGVTLGAAVQNLGSELEFIAEGDPQPLALRVGAAWRSANRRFLVAADAAFDREATVTWHAGLEAYVAGGFYGRIGAVLSPDVTRRRSFTAGVGFESPVGRLDYAYQSFGEDFNANHRFTYAYAWGKPRPSERATRRGATRRGEGIFYRPDEIPPPEERPSGPTFFLRDGRRKVAVGGFENLTRDRRLDWLEPALGAIVERTVRRREDDLRLVAGDEAEGAYHIDGRFAEAGEGALLWVSVRLYDGDGRLLAFEDGIVSEEDLLRGAQALASRLLSEIPRD